MSARLPLLPAGSAPDVPMFWGEDGAITRGRFAAGVAALAARLPDARHVVNLCDDRYAFCTALAAAALRGATTLLPPSAGAAALEALRVDYPGALVVHDEGADCIGLPIARTAPAATLDALPALAADHDFALVFTSGSTGRPQPHRKTWRALHRAGELVAARLLPGAPTTQIVATVPMQHMYGLETAALLPLAAGHAVFAGRPVFPDDVRAALERLPAPRLLVTAPVHIRALLAAGTRLPPLALILSATAPLSAELAAQAEAAFGAPVHEIYGCTEAGSLATRRSVEGPDWRLLDGIELAVDGGQAAVRAPHLPGEVALQDRIETRPGGFRLLGRATDLLKVGGRRASAADLTQKLLSIPGVVDGVVFQPQPAGDDAVVQRPAALVVAPGLSEAEITAALARLIDPIFLPRPLRRIAALPRNAVGKLPQAALERLLAGPRA